MESSSRQKGGRGVKRAARPVEALTWTTRIAGEHTPFPLHLRVPVTRAVEHVALGFVPPESSQKGLHMNPETELLLRHLNAQRQHVIAACGDLQARGVTFLNGPANTAWGLQTAYFPAVIESDHQRELIAKIGARADRTRRQVSRVASVRCVGQRSRHRRAVTIVVSGIPVVAHSETELVCVEVDAVGQARGAEDDVSQSRWNWPSSHEPADSCRRHEQLGVMERAVEELDDESAGIRRLQLRTENVELRHCLSRR